MGYDVHITRASDWSANSGAEISAAEWQAIVESDSDLSADPTNGPFSARFGATAWFDWFEGNVFTTDPEPATVDKMIDLARRLSAAVQGDDGEFYESANDWARTAHASGSPRDSTG